MLTIGMLFWILYIVGLIFYGYRNYSTPAAILDSLFWWVLIFLLGWKTFGFPIGG